MIRQRLTRGLAAATFAVLVTVGGTGVASAFPDPDPIPPQPIIDDFFSGQVPALAHPHNGPRTAGTGQTGMVCQNPGARCR